MADTKITGLTADTTPTSDDLIPTVTDPAGTPANRKVTLANAITKAHGLSDGIVKVVTGTMTVVPATTASIAASTDKNYVTDAQAAVLGNTSGTNTGDSATPAETSTTIGALIGGAGDATPNDTDFVATSLTAGGILKKITWTNVKAFLKTYFDTLYAGVLGSDDNYVTDAEKVKLSNLSGTNTGDQDISGKANSAGALTQFVGNNAWKVWYADSLGDVVELALGADGTFLKSNGAAAAPSFATPAGSGDVSKVGTPANNQVGVWTGDGTLEGDASLTFDTTTDTLSVAASGKIAMGAVNIIDDTAGTTTLSNIDALDATTEATIEAAIDTLANLTSVQGRTVTLADAGADALLGWDDSASAYQNLSAADARTALELANVKTRQMEFIIGDGTNVITTGEKKSARVQIPVGGTITEWTLLSLDDTSGSIALDIWKDTYANYPPTVADTITASAKPSITTATKNTSSTLTGWTTSITAGDILSVNVDSVTSLKVVKLIVKYTVS